MKSSGNYGFRGAAWVLGLRIHPSEEFLPEARFGRLGAIAENSEAAQGAASAVPVVA